MRVAYQYCSFAHAIRGVNKVQYVGAVYVYTHDESGAIILDSVRM